MTGRERVLAVLNRRTPDRIPFEIGGTDCSSIHVLPYRKIRAMSGLPDKPVPCPCLIQLIADPEPELKEALRTDAEMLPFGARENKVWRAPFGADLVVPEKFNPETLANGDTVIRAADGRVSKKMSATGHYFDAVGMPLAEITSPAELDRFDDLFQRWDYSAVYDENIEEYAARAKKQYEATDRAVVALWRLHYLQSGQLMRGYEQFFVDLMVDKPMAHALLRKLHDVYLDRVDRFLAAMGDCVDIIFLTDDLGTQQSGLISPDLYEEMIYPYARELLDRIKRSGKKIVMHSCGAVSAFIPYLIDMGVDALNPVQVAASGMNPADLVREYGKDIAFWGGGCDTQHALNAADPEDVRADVHRRLREFEGGHLVFTQVHNIQYDVPPENILAMQDEFFKQAG